jgi:hypothetical protein
MFGPDPPLNLIQLSLSADIKETSDVLVLRLERKFSALHLVGTRAAVRSAKLMVDAQVR